MRFLHSVLVQERAVAVDSIEVDDLAVNPLSVILICIRPLNNTGTLLDYAQYLNIVGSLNNISVLHNGSRVISMNGRDAAALAYFRHGVVAPQAVSIDTDDFRRCVVLPIFMGRFAYDPNSCFPATKRGELTLELDIDVADTGYNGFRFSVETIELLDAQPKEFERKVVSNLTFASTGDNDFDIPMGNVNRGILLFGTTGFTGAVPAPTWGRISLFLDNQQVGFSSTDFEVAHMLSSLSGRQPPSMDGHQHRVDATQANVAELVTFPHNTGSGGWQNYAFLDFDPTRDDMFSIDTSKSSRFHLRSSVETANAVRAISIEKIGA